MVADTLCRGHRDAVPAGAGFVEVDLLDGPAPTFWPSRLPVSRDTASTTSATGAGYSVREVPDAARSVTGRDIPSADEGRRAGDPAALVASSARIREELGWKPRKPDLKDIVADAWDLLHRQR
ncbi:hypothetical protein BH24ACT1_BH24ACT1_11800 [soil metagenome]